MQVDPIKPALKAPGINLLKLKYDKPPSNFALKFNLRRYNLDRFVLLAAGSKAGRCRFTPDVYGYRVRFIQIKGQVHTDVGSDVTVQVDHIRPTLKAPGTKRLKL